MVDRKKDVVISGGENIYSAEVEDVIRHHAKVGDVAVIGVADPKWGETPWAIVGARTPRTPPPKTSCWSTAKRDGVVQEAVVVRDLEGDLPRNAMGKVTKPALRTQYGGQIAR